MSSPAPTPSRIKLYGLFRMTRRTYLRVLVVELILVAGMMAAGLIAMIRAGQVFPELTHPSRAPVREWVWQQMFVALFWAGLLGLILQLFETVIVLKRFARAEPEQKPPQAAVPPVGTSLPTDATATTNP
jgi:hypothetical protein